MSCRSAYVSADLPECDFDPSAMALSHWLSRPEHPWRSGATRTQEALQPSRTQEVFSPVPWATRRRFSASQSVRAPITQRRNSRCLLLDAVLDGEVNDTNEVYFGAVLAEARLACSSSSSTATTLPASDGGFGTTELNL